MLEFFKQELWLIPNWAWFAIVLGVACLLIAIIIIACKKGGKAKDESGTKEESVEVKQAEEKQEPVKQEVAEAKAEEPKQEVKEEKTTEKKSTTTKTTTKTESSKTTAKPAAGKTSAKSTTTKSTTKSTAAKSTAAKKEEEKSAAKEEPTETKVYHISKRKEDKKWQVKAEGADKALRLFFTQTDAIEYAKKVAGNQSGRIVIHKEGGGFRKLNY